MRTREFKSHCEGCANGSTVLHLNKQAIPTFEFPEPVKTKVAKFTEQAKGIVNKIFLSATKVVKIDNLQFELRVQNTKICRIADSDCQPNT